MVPRPAASAPRVLLELHITGSPFGPTDQKRRQGWGPAVCGGTSPPGDSDGCSLRTAGVEWSWAGGNAWKRTSRKNRLRWTISKKVEEVRNSPTPPSGRPRALLTRRGRGSTWKMQCGEGTIRPGWRAGENARPRPGPKCNGEAAGGPSSRSPLLPVPAPCPFCLPR